MPPVILEIQEPALQGTSKIFPISIESQPIFYRFYSHSLNRGTNFVAFNKARIFQTLSEARVNFNLAEMHYV